MNTKTKLQLVSNDEYDRYKQSMTALGVIQKQDKFVIQDCTQKTKENEEDYFNSTYLDFWK